MGGPQRRALGPLRRRLQRPHEKLSEKVARSIAEDIVRLDLPPGTRLQPESEMLEHFGIGRPTLREALRILEFQGLITLKLGHTGGPIVATPAPEDFARVASMHLQSRRVTLRHVLELRLVLEPLAAATAARDRDDAGLVALGMSLNEQLPIEPPGALESRQEIGSFHRCVATLGANPMVSLMTISSDLLCVRLRYYPKTKLTRVQDQHLEIADAIRRRDEKGAEQSMRTHLEEFIAFALDGREAQLDAPIEWA